MISNCCGAVDRLQSEDGPSFSDVGICPKCKEHCEFEKETKGAVKLKITKTASGKHKLNLSKKEWISMGVKTGWISKEKYVKAYSRMKGNKIIELYRMPDGTVSVIDDMGEAFEAEIIYSYSPPEPKEYESGLAVYPGAPADVDILSVIDSATNSEVPVNSESVLETYRDSLIEDYEDMKRSTEEAALEDKWDRMIEEKRSGLY